MSARTALRSASLLLGRPAFIGTVVGLAVILSSLVGSWEVAELKLLDRHLRLRGPVRHQREVVIVGIGEETFLDLDRPWPFPRAVIARAVEIIEAAKPKAIGLDFLFTEPSLFGPEDDAALAAVLRKHDDVTLGALFWYETGEPATAGPQAGVRRVYQVLRLPVEPLPRTSVGFLNIPHDGDGFVRRVPLYLDFRTAGRIESFAAQLAKAASRAGSAARPLAREMLINFRGPTRSFETVPFHQVVRGEVAPQTFAGKIVLIGATSPVLHDVFHTPFTPRDPMPGVEIQANALDNLLRGDPLRPAGRSIALALAILAALAGTRLGSRIQPPRSFVMVAAIGCAVAITAHVALTWYQLWIEQVPILLALFGTYFAMLVSGTPFRKVPPLSPPASPAA